MPGQRQDRAVLQVLLDLGGQPPVELAQHDADAGIGVARPQRHLQVQLIVPRQGQQRNCVLDPGRFKAGAALRAALDKGRSDRLDRRGEFLGAGPQHNDPMVGQAGQLAGRAERQHVAADDDDRGVGGSRHRRALSLRRRRHRRQRMAGRDACGRRDR